jgi:hypothetical protein
VRDGYDGAENKGNDCHFISYFQKNKSNILKLKSSVVVKNSAQEKILSSFGANTGRQNDSLHWCLE